MYNDVVLNTQQITDTEATNIMKININTKIKLEKIGALHGPDAQGRYTLIVNAPDSERDGADEYERVCDETMAAVRAAVPCGWDAHWAGVGNTDQNGDCTEDIYIDPDPR